MLASRLASMRATGRIWARRGALAAAATAGSAAVGSAAVALCDAPAPKAPPFVLGGDRYDQSTFEGRLAKIQAGVRVRARRYRGDVGEIQGRYRADIWEIFARRPSPARRVRVRVRVRVGVRVSLAKIQEVIDVRTVLTSDEELARCQARIAEFKQLGRLPDGVDDEAMWEAQRTVNAIIHGPTGEKMFLPGRMSMFVPMNVPATAGMIMARSVPVTLFWQWANQTYNVVNNYVCRAGPEVEMGSLAQSYGLAVTISCGIAVGAGKMLKAFPRLQMFGLIVPYLAVISAGSCNVGFTRMDEIRNGIFVKDKDGKVVGRSVTAGQTAVYLTVTTRSMFIPLFSLIGPPLIMKAVYATGAVAAGTSVALVLEVGAVAAMLAVGLPFALALQPLEMELDVAKLEPHFQGLTTADGAPLRHVYASKGM